LKAVLEIFQAGEGVIAVEGLDGISLLRGSNDVEVLHPTPRRTGGRPRSTDFVLVRERRSTRYLRTRGVRIHKHAERTQVGDGHVAFGSQSWRHGEHGRGGE